jgi:hypothetical protein
MPARTLFSAQTLGHRGHPIGQFGTARRFPATRWWQDHATYRSPRCRSPSPSSLSLPDLPARTRSSTQAAGIGNSAAAQRKYEHPLDGPCRTVRNASRVPAQLGGRIPATSAVDTWGGSGDDHVYDNHTATVRLKRRRLAAIASLPALGISQPERSNRRAPDQNSHPIVSSASR